MRIRVSTGFLGAYTAFSLYLLNWKNLNVLCTDDAYEKDFYNSFVSSTENYGMAITNREEFRMLNKNVEIA